MSLGKKLYLADSTWRENPYFLWVVEAIFKINYFSEIYF